MKKEVVGYSSRMGVLETLTEWEARWTKALIRVEVECAYYGGITNHGVLIWFGTRMLWLRPYRSKLRKKPMVVRSFLYLPERPTDDVVRWVKRQTEVAEP